MATTETCWDASHNMSAVTDGYKLLKNGQVKKRVGEIFLYAKIEIDCTKLVLKNNDVQVKSLWMQTRD